MKSNARAAVLALLGTAVITLVSVGTQTMEGSTGLIVTAIVSFLVMLAIVYADRNLKRARRVVPSGPRVNGTIKWFNVSKGYGFITQDSGEDVFVHYRSLRNQDRYSIKEGMAVTFIMGRSGKGPQAEDVAQAS